MTGNSIRGILLAVLFASASAKVHVETVLWMDFYGSCDLPLKLPLRHNESGVESVAKTSMGYGTLVNTQDIKTFDKAIVSIIRCKDSADQNCELFQTWRFGSDTCTVINMKNAFWTPMFSYTPPLNCPIKKGVYSIRNATLDMQALARLNFPKGSYWRVYTRGFYSEKQMFCIAYAGRFLRQTRH